MATLHARGELPLHTPFVHESIIGSQFIGELTAETSVAGIPAVIPTLSGQAWITQHCQIVVDPTDPFPVGYTVGDIWG
jgi:proline racemase